MSARDDLLTIVHTWLIECAEWAEDMRREINNG